MHEYICYTKQSHWTFYADNDLEAARLGLFFAWRDGEDFIKIENASGRRYTIRVCIIDDNLSISTL